MKSDFVIAITQLAAEKNLPKEVVLEAVEAALVSAFRKDSALGNQDISVKLAPQSGEFQVYVRKVVVEKVTEDWCEISLSEARKIKEDAQVGDTLEVESTPPNAGRIAAQTAKQVVLQRLHEAERDAVFTEYASREGDIISGVVQRIEPRQIIVGLGRAEAVLPSMEQVRSEHYRVGQRIKVYITEVLRVGKGPQVVGSRAHPGLLRRLFELEIPEIHQGIVEIKAVAREAGARSKVAVSARQKGIDPVGCCVGLRGVRIQNIVGELNGEKIDVVQWHPDLVTFIASALSPASVLNMELNAEENAAVVVVPDRQLSLAIGREGQNVRLAAKLTGWRIDIKSASVAEEEKAAREAEGIFAEGEVAVIQDVEEQEQEPTSPSEILIEEHGELIEEVEAQSGNGQVIEEEEPASVVEFVSPPPYLVESTGTPGERQIRFAEDLLVPSDNKPGARGKKAKKRAGTGHKRDDIEDGTGPVRSSRVKQFVPDEDELDEM